MKYLVLFSLFFWSCALFGQASFQSEVSQPQGTMDVKGHVVDAKTGEPVIGANVVIKGTTRGATTDIDGSFLLMSVPKGQLTVTVTYVSYKPYEQTFNISDEKELFLDIKLEENVVMISTVNVVSAKVTDTEISMMQTIRQNNLVVNGVPSQLIKKTQDRDAGEVVRRIPGITIQDGRFVIIRGLNERYNSVWLNNLPAPGSEADVRAFSFDFVPASVIDNVVVYKTFSPELPGDFAGGLVQISTISNPDKNFLNFSVSNGYAPGSSFEQHKLYPIEGSGWFNNTSSLALPDAFPTNIATIPSTEAGRDEKTLWGQSMNKTWTPQTINAPTDQKISLTGGFQKSFGKTNFAAYMQLNYSNSFSQDSVFRAAYNAYDEVAQHPDTSYVFNDVQYNSSVKTGAMLNLSLSKGKSKFEFRNLYNQLASNRVTDRNGHDFYGGIILKGLEMSARTRRMYSGQFSGTHALGSKENKLKWYGGYSASSQLMPDNKRLTWVLNDQEDSPYYQQYGLNFSFAANSNLSGRIFHDLNEQIYNAGSDLTVLLKVKSYEMTLKTGFFAELRHREFSARNLGYKIARTSLFDWSLPYESIDVVFSNDNINSTDGIMLDEQTNPSDSYTSETRLMAGYVALTLPVSARIKIHGGFRAEKSIVNLDSYAADATNPPSDDDAVHYISDTLLILPAINVTYHLSERSLIRGAYGQTVNRPEYREIAPMSFYDYELKAVISGNDSLTFARIRNFDLRYEFYPDHYSMFSVGVFAKQFQNAIEYKVIPTGSGLQYTFQNTPEAWVSGVEAEFRITGDRFKGLPLLKNFTFVFNGALMSSNISFGDESLEENRSLQGQSPYILNAAMFYQNDTLAFNAGLMYNLVGKRISFAGDPFSGNPHVYEMASGQLDMSVGKQFGKHIEVKASAKNLLNQQVEYLQDVETSQGVKTQTTLRYRPGRYYTLGLVWKF